MFRAKNTFLILCALSASVVNIFSQTETPPPPSAPRSVTVPTISQKKLPNGMTIAVAAKKGVPLVTINLLLNAGAALEDESEEGVADLTASLLTKGTKTRTATQIAEQLESLGGTINASAGWNGTNVLITVTSDKVDQAVAIMSDIVLNPSFSQSELDLLKTQTLDGLKYNLTQPGFLASYAASRYSFNEHPTGGTPETIKALTRKSVMDFYGDAYHPGGATLIFSGDVTIANATLLANKFFSRWHDKRKEIIQDIWTSPASPPDVTQPRSPELGRILVIDLPQSGQASVNYAKSLPLGRVDVEAKGFRVSKSYYPGIVLNTVLGGGYSSRLNYEIRIKRGLSYGAGSNVAWRYDDSNFITRAQTKNESAAEVAELTLAEIKRLTDSTVASDELVPRKSTLTGEFGMGLETTNGLARAVSDLYTFGIPASELNSFDSNVNAVTDAQIRDFASKNLLGGDMIIAGDYSVFKDDLAKRFPNMTIEVIKADDLDLSKDNLRK